jgi:hypothetical protein
MPSAKLRGTNPRYTGTLEEQARKLLEQMPSKKSRGDVDITPATGLPTFYAERPPPKIPMSQSLAADIDALVKRWVEQQKKKRGQPPSRTDIEIYRGKLTERYRREEQEPAPTPEIHEVAEPETRIRGA